MSEGDDTKQTFIGTHKGSIGLSVGTLIAILGVMLPQLIPHCRQQYQDSAMVVFLKETVVAHDSRIYALEGDIKKFTSTLSGIDERTKNTSDSVKRIEDKLYIIPNK